MAQCSIHSGRWLAQRLLHRIPRPREGRIAADQEPSLQEDPPYQDGELRATGPRRLSFWIAPYKIVSVSSVHAAAHADRASHQRNANNYLDLALKSVGIVTLDARNGMLDDGPEHDPGEWSRSK